MVTPQAGQIWGNYQLKRFIAKGGFGWVFAAEHKWLKSQVAIKILDTTPYRLQKDIEQFLAEAQKLQALRHPNIVEVKDFGIAHDMPYLVMPLYQTSLSSTCGHILPLPTIIVYVKQIAAALNFVHQYQIVHRDIKPENFLLGNNGEIILSDFGIAIITHSIISDQEYAGTAPYMPPEQWRAKAVRASDQYALAIVVYQWLCGELPFHGTALEVMGQHINLQPPSLRVRNSTIGQDVERVVMKALAKDPTQRFRTILEFAEALEKAAKQFSLKLLLTIPLNETFHSAQWVWGNHYLFVVSKSGKMEMTDVLTKKIVFSATFNRIGDYAGVYWRKENCTVGFNDGGIILNDRKIIDKDTGKEIALIEDDVILISDSGIRPSKQSSEEREIATLANSLIALDPSWPDMIKNEMIIHEVYQRYNFIPNIISLSTSRMGFCLPHWHYVAVARVNEQRKFSRIEAYQVIRP